MRLPSGPSSTMRRGAPSKPVAPVRSRSSSGRNGSGKLTAPGGSSCRSSSSWSRGKGAEGRTKEMKPEGKDEPMRPAPSYIHGATNVPLLGETIGDNLRRTVDRFGQREALVVSHQCYRATYRQLWD